MSSNHQIFAVDKQAKDIYSELKKCFLKEYSDLTLAELLTTKFGPWIDTQS